MTYRVETKQLVSPVFSLSFGMTVTIKLAMAATTKPNTTTFFRPNLTKESEKIAIFHCLRLVEIICLLILISIDTCVFPCLDTVQWQILFLDQNEACKWDPKGKKNFFETGQPHDLRVWMKFEDCNCGFWKLDSLTVFQSSFSLFVKLETYLFHIKR